MGYMRILRTYQLLITSPFLLLHSLPPSLYIFTVCSVYSEFGREVSRATLLLRQFLFEGSYCERGAERRGICSASSVCRELRLFVPHCKHNLSRGIPPHTHRWTPEVRSDFTVKYCLDWCFFSPPRQWKTLYFNVLFLVIQNCFTHDSLLQRTTSCELCRSLFQCG